MIRRQHMNIVLLLAAMSLAAASAGAASIDGQIVNALRRAHPEAQTIRLIGSPKEYALANVYCGKYLTQGRVSEYAYDVSGVSKGQPAKLRSDPHATCERLAKDRAERAYASMRSDLKRDIAEGEARKRKLLQQQTAAENELLDLKVQEVLGRYSAENVAKMRDLCFKIFNGYSEILRYEQNKYGATGSRKDLNAFVLNRTRQSGSNSPRTKQCGYWFAEQLGKHPKALQFAVADFTAFHTINERDYHNAQMLQLIYATGRGGRPDPNRAAAWDAEAKRRIALSGGK